MKDYLSEELKIPSGNKEIRFNIKHICQNADLHSFKGCGENKHFC